MAFLGGLLLIMLIVGLILGLAGGLAIRPTASRINRFFRRF